MCFVYEDAVKAEFLKGGDQRIFGKVHQPVQLLFQACFCRRGFLCAQSSLTFADCIVDFGLDFAVRKALFEFFQIRFRKRDLREVLIAHDNSVIVAVPDIGSKDGSLLFAEILRVSNENIRGGEELPEFRSPLSDKAFRADDKRPFDRSDFAELHHSGGNDGGLACANAMRKKRIAAAHKHTLHSIFLVRTQRNRRRKTFDGQFRSIILRSDVAVELLVESFREIFRPCFVFKEPFLKFRAHGSADPLSSLRIVFVDHGLLFPVFAFDGVINDKLPPVEHLFKDGNGIPACSRSSVFPLDGV